LANPDDPRRPVNSPDNRYQIAPTLLKLARTYGSPAWMDNLTGFLKNAEGLRRLHPRERETVLIPVRLPNGTELKITAGGQNVLVKKIVEDFCPRFTPGGVVIYVGDTGDKQRHIESGYLEQLGVEMDEQQDPRCCCSPPGKELARPHRSSQAGLVFVTSFLTRRAMTKHLADIAWETEVWIAEAPSHIIHFNGERFLGPYG